MDGNRDSGYRPEFVNANDSERSSNDTAFIEKESGDSDGTKSADVEAQSPLENKRANAPEYGIPTRTKYLYLGLYFTLNLALTLYNKAVLGKACQILTTMEAFPSAWRFTHSR